MKPLAVKSIALYTTALVALCIGGISDSLMVQFIAFAVILAAVFGLLLPFSEGTHADDPTQLD